MVLHTKERKMVYDVYCFMKKEADCNIVRNLKQCIKRTAEATNCSESTVRRILKCARESKLDSVFRTPGKNKRIKQKPVTDIDSFDQGDIKRIIHNFHVTEKKMPTINVLRAKLQVDLNFEGSAASLRRIIKKMGFKFKRTEKNRKILIEKSQIRFQRIQYLNNLKKYREEGRHIIYTGETCLDSPIAPYQTSTEGSTGSTKGGKKPVAKGNRLVIVHAGCEAGFVPNALLTFLTSTKNIMNSENYEQWLRTKLIPNLPPNSVVVVGSASYHNKKLNATPSANSKKADMQAWLRERGIEFEESMLKPELYNLIKPYRYQFTQFSIDVILNEAGHSVLRLPPYHSDLNPIEMTWSLIKGYVATKNISWDLARITELVNEKVNLMGAAEWEKLCAEVKQMETDYCKNDHVIDMMTESLTINVEDDDSEDSNNDESSSDENSNDESDTASSSGDEYPYHVPVQVTHDD